MKNKGKPEGADTEELRIAQKRFRSLIDSIPVGIAISTPDGRSLERNKALQEMYGYESREEFMKVPLIERYYDSEDEKRLLSLLEKGPVKDFEVRQKRRDGTVFWASLTSTFQTGESGEQQLLVVTQDIDKRKSAEKALQQSEEKYRSLVENVRLGLFRSTPEPQGRFLEINKAMEEITGYSRQELLEINVSDLYVHPEQRETILREAVSAIGKVTKELKLRRRDGTEIVVSDTKVPVKDKDGKVLYFDGILEDITERKKIEAQLIVTDRLASIGELASGFAHELNNPLTAIIGFSDLLSEIKDLPHDVKEVLKTINGEAQRTAQVVRNLLTFARRHPQEKQPVDINSVIQKVLALRAYKQRVNNIQVRTQLATDLPEVMADDFQLQQVFLNIIINAEYFMVEAHGRGTLTITTECAGNIVRATLTDDGPGIPKENMGRIFDPFFTTKEVGKGTGLGLSICHGIVTAHDGRIYAESELGQGATFVVELPI